MSSMITKISYRTKNKGLFVSYFQYKYELRSRSWSVWNCELYFYVRRAKDIDIKSCKYGDISFCHSNLRQRRKYLDISNKLKRKETKGREIHNHNNTKNKQKKIEVKISSTISTTTTAITYFMK